MGELENIDQPKAKPTATKSRAGKGRVGKGPGAPSTYTLDIADLICAGVAEGRSLRSVLLDDGMPAMSTVFKWLREHDEFSEQYTRAKDASADALADEIIDVAHKTLKGTHDPQSARVAVDALKWSASKLKPKVYGDKLDLTTGNEKLNRGMSDAELNAILARAGSIDDQAGAGTQAR